MKEFALVGTPRSEYGKKAAKALRAEELIPCNIPSIKIASDMT